MHVHKIHKPHPASVSIAQSYHWQSSLMLNVEQSSALVVDNSYITKASIRAHEIVRADTEKTLIWPFRNQNSHADDFLNKSFAFILLADFSFHQVVRVKSVDWKFNKYRSGSAWLCHLNGFTQSRNNIPDSWNCCSEFTKRFKERQLVDILQAREK